MAYTFAPSKRPLDEGMDGLAVKVGYTGWLF